MLHRGRFRPLDQLGHFLVNLLANLLVPRDLFRRRRAHNTFSELVGHWLEFRLQPAPLGLRDACAVAIPTQPACNSQRLCL